mgnify:CR=1 FL=1
MDNYIAVIKTILLLLQLPKIAGLLMLTLEILSPANSIVKSVEGENYFMKA